MGSACTARQCTYPVCTLYYNTKGTVYIYIVLCVNVQYCIVPCIVQNRDSTLYEVKCAIKVLKAKYIQKSKMFFSSFYI